MVLSLIDSKLLVSGPDLKTFPRRNRAKETIMQSTEAEPSSTSELSTFLNELDVLLLTENNSDLAPFRIRANHATINNCTGLNGNNGIHFTGDLTANSVVLNCTFDKTIKK